MLRSARLTTLVLAAALALGGCAAMGGPGDDGTGDGGTLEGDWMLTSGADASGPFDLAGTSVTLTVAGDNGSGGRGPCNSYGATVNGGPGEVSIVVGAMTEMACVDQSLMELESRYVAALGAVDAATRTADELVLTGEGVELNFALVEPEPTAELEGTTWTLESLVEGTGEDGSVSSILTESTLEFGDRLDGHSGCRAFFADYSLDGSQLTISNLVSNEAESCMVDIMEQETHVLEVLDGTIEATIDGQQLTLVNPATDTGLTYRASR